MKIRKRHPTKTRFGRILCLQNHLSMNMFELWTYCEHLWKSKIVEHPWRCLMFVLKKTQNSILHHSTSNKSSGCMSLHVAACRCMSLSLSLLFNEHFSHTSHTCKTSDSCISCISCNTGTCTINSNELKWTSSKFLKDCKCGSSASSSHDGKTFGSGSNRKLQHECVTEGVTEGAASCRPTWSRDAFFAFDSICLHLVSFLTHFSPSICIIWFERVLSVVSVLNGFRLFSSRLTRLSMWRFLLTMSHTWYEIKMIRKTYLHRFVLYCINHHTLIKKHSSYTHHTTSMLDVSGPSRDRLGTVSGPSRDVYRLRSARVSTRCTVALELSDLNLKTLPVNKSHLWNTFATPFESCLNHVWNM